MDKHFQSLMQKAQEMQDTLKKAQEDIASSLIEGQAGAGLVTVVLTGNFQLKKVHIDKTLLDPKDKDMLQDLIIAAYNAAAKKIDAQNQKNVSGLSDIQNMFANTLK